MHTRLPVLRAVGVPWERIRCLRSVESVSARFAQIGAGGVDCESNSSQPGQFDALADEKLSDVVVRPILVQEDWTKILMSTEDGNEVRSLSSLEVVNGIAREPATPPKWGEHPLKAELLHLVSSITLEAYEWEDLEKLSAHVEDVTPTANVPQPIPSVETSIRSRSFCVLRECSTANMHQWKLEVYNSAAINPERLVISPLAIYEDLASRDIKKLIGLHEGSLLFLTHQGWVCSLDVSGTGPEQTYIRHFFIPFKYHNSGGSVLIVVNSAGIIMLNFNGKVVTFENGLNFVEKVHFGTSSAPGLSSTKLSVRSTLHRGHSAPVT